MSKVFKFEFKDTLSPGIDKYFNMVGINKGIPKKADRAGRQKASTFLIESIVNGSSGNPMKPPILTGALRASGSAHVATLPAHHTTDNKPVRPPEKATPNKGSAGGGRDDLTVGLNRPYAARWETDNFIPGEISEQDGPVGSFSVESHINSDAKEVTKIYAETVKKESGG